MQINSSKSDVSKEEEQLISAMQLLGDKTRYKIFKLLMTSREMCVTEIADNLQVSVSAVSQHFRQFELVGLVEKERLGQKICYTLDDSNTLVREFKRIVLRNNLLQH